jgi:hypothetical protein
MPSKQPSMDKLQAVAEIAEKRYLHRPNVTGVDIGYRWKDGKRTDEIAVRVHVKEKIPPHALEAAEVIPETIDDIPIDVIEARYRPGDKNALPARESTPAGHRTRRDPLFPGISVCHKDSTAGTLGAFVIDLVSGNPGILSNWHVLAGATARPGDAILQPGPFDGGRNPQDAVAALERMLLNADGDAAIALLNGSRGWSPVIFGTDQLLLGTKRANLGDVLIKSGRTTGVTRGKVDGFGVYTIQYDVGPKSIKGFKLVARKDGNPDNEEISSGGDSGSIWYDETDLKAVGLHFAGETDPNPREENARLSCRFCLPRAEHSTCRSPRFGVRGSNDRRSRAVRWLTGLWTPPCNHRVVAG